MSAESFSNVQSPEIKLPSDYFTSDSEDEEDEYINGWEDTWLHQKYKTRVRQGRDLVITVIGENASTGTGKTTLGVQLGHNMDRTDDGLSPDKASLYLDELMMNYKNQPEQSALVGDEAQEMADSRRAMSTENVEFSKMMAMARFREMYLILTLPDADMLDKRLKKRADVLIVASEKTKGKGRVYELQQDDLNSSGNVRTKFQEEITWGPMDDDPVYQKLSADKEVRFDELLSEYFGEETGKAEEKKRIEEKARDEARDLNRHGESIRSIREKLSIESPNSEDGKWSTSTIQGWVKDVDKGSALRDD